VEVDVQPAAARAADDAPTMTKTPRIESFPNLVIRDLFLPLRLLSLSPPVLG
jgi:hypothetical protein